MKKIQVLLISIIVFISLMISSCKTSEKYNCPSAEDKIDFDRFREGWCDENTYMITTGADVDLKIKDAEKRRIKSCDIAVLTAQVMAIDHFKDKCFPVNGACGIYDEGEARRIDAIIKEFTGIVKNGSVVHTEYNDKESCLVRYKISNPGLHKFYENCGEK